MTLPSSQTLPVHQLAGCFKNTSAAYKFYWFLAILGRVERGDSSISKIQLFADMVAESWYTINYFQVSFGKQDRLQQASAQIRRLEGLTIDAPKHEISAQLYRSLNPSTRSALWYFNTEVPHRFLSPWIHAADRRQAYALSQQYDQDCPYALDEEHIHINPKWLGYLSQHTGILKAFCYWHLSGYLQLRNPSVPDLTGKLIKTPVRKALSAQRKYFWDTVIAELGSVACIYTNSPLRIGTYAVEHFLPYAFVSHDLIWNLIPADPAFNSIKSDKLPLLDKYFQPYFNLQQSAVEIIRAKNPGNRFLQDYLSILPGLEPADFNAPRMLEQIRPLITIASNNGFHFMAEQ